ncbi:unnamed protein product [Orchesella dallaii]|uniref:Ig-like domain-containing protein n=1 Tax=Orchesella dallaii TaxID=48710 RepID=A0ABP1S4F1_9HEXA
MFSKVILAYFSILLAVGSQVSAESVNAVDGIDWVGSRVVDLSDLTLGGKEDNQTLFVCRAQWEGDWIPGKARVDAQDGILRCHFQYWQVGHNSTDFEVLVWPSETTSWVETEGSIIPNRAVVSGIDPGNDEVTYVCRAWHGNELIVGKALESFGVCFIAADGEPRISKYEVLVKNAYGVYELGE